MIRLGRARAPLLAVLPAALVSTLLGSPLLAAHPTKVIAEPTPGSSGIGDPYWPLDGNGGINVLRYDVHDRYRFTTGRLSGWTTLKIRATQDLPRFNLDFLLPVTGVLVDGAQSAAHRKLNRHELQITPLRTIEAGTTFRVLVRYSGKPGPVEYAGDRSWLANDREVVTMNEPHMAPWWFPANDHPLDKARMDITITTPKGKQVVANGRLVQQTVRDGLATTHWRSREPMVPYLAFFAAGRFQIAKGTYQGLPWYVAVSKALAPTAQRSSMRLMKRTPAVTAFLERRLGNYPFESTGGLTTSLDPGFALENQTRPTYPFLGASGLRLVVHEIAHQWLGDSVAVRRWSDIWLNEGLATFMEVHYAERHGGQSGRQWLDQTHGGIQPGSEFWDQAVDDPGRDHIFAQPVYVRGAMTAQALRNRIGEADFWKVLRTWVRTRANGNGSSAQFETLAERISGENLAAFFDTWLRVLSRPARTEANGF